LISGTTDTRAAVRAEGAEMLVRTLRTETNETRFLVMEKKLRKLVAISVRQPCLRFCGVSLFALPASCGWSDFHHHGARLSDATDTHHTMSPQTTRSTTPTADLDTASPGLHHS